jgi:hypothetical protein
MDDSQRKLKDLQKTVPGCVDNRQKLRSALSDLLPAEKLRCNLILNAYDEEIVSKLTGGRDTTLAALNMIKVLKDSYGITDDLAFWSVESWCYILGLDEVADAMSVVRPAAGAGNIPVAAPANKQTYTIGLGVYKAGVDFPVGEIAVKVNETPKLSIFYGVGKNPNKINDEQSFLDKVYLKMQEGQYLKLGSFETGKTYTFTVTAID